MGEVGVRVRLFIDDALLCISWCKRGWLRSHEVRTSDSIGQVGTSWLATLVLSVMQPSISRLWHLVHESPASKLWRDPTLI